MGYVLLITSPGYLILLILTLIDINNKKTYWVAGTALVVLLAGLFVYIALFFPQNPNDCAKFKDINKLNVCYWNFAKKNNDVSLCNKLIGDNDYINSCLSDLAYQQLDPQICRLFKDATIVTQDGCFHMVANQKYDPTICKEIKNDSIKNLCLSYNSAKEPNYFNFTTSP